MIGSTFKRVKYLKENPENVSSFPTVFFKNPFSSKSVYLMMYGKVLFHYCTMRTFNDPGKKNLLNTWRENGKKKMLVIGIFSIFNIFYPIKNKVRHLSQIQVVDLKIAFDLDKI